MNMVHNIQRGKTVSGTVKSSWMKLTFNADDLDFRELTKIHDAFPRLFEPAFRLQQNIMIHTLGEIWWTRKKRSLQDLKDLADSKIVQMKAKKEAKKQNKKNRKTQRNMGLIKYYLCPCLRKYYDPSATDYDKMTDEEKAEMDRQLAIARRQAELKVKNPETIHWLKYQEKIEKDLEQLEKIQEEEKIDDGNKAESDVHEDEPEDESTEISSPKADPKPKSYLEDKLQATARPREERAFLRQERKRQRINEIGNRRR
jgi:hypothetical protein